MPISAAERRFIMDQLSKRAQEDLAQLWDAARRYADEDFARYIAGRFPDIVIPYHQLAADFAASVFEKDFPDVSGTVVTAPPPDAGELTNSADWALGADGRKALDRMSGTIQRTVYNGDRDTTVANAEIAGMRWVRIARPEACAFCRLLASRSTAQYRSEESATNIVGRNKKGVGRVLRGTRQYGEKYHDDCKCTAKAIPAGTNVLKYLYATEPDTALTVEQWNNEYLKAQEAAGSGDIKDILSQWRQLGEDIA